MSESDDLLRDQIERMQKRAEGQPNECVGVHVDENDAIAVEALFRVIEDPFDGHVRQHSDVPAGDIGDAKKRFRAAVQKMRQAKPENPPKGKLSQP